MSVSLIDGWIGKGKTLLMTYFATIVDKPVYANYQIDIPNFRTLSPEILPEINEPSLILIDEAYTWLESRKSMSNISIYLSYILYQSRKRGLDFILTVQDISSVDIRFRNHADYIIHAEGLKDDVYRYSMTRGRKSDRKVNLSLSMDKAKEIYKIYDTMQMVNPIDENMISDIATNPEILNNRIDEIVDKIEQTFPPDFKITKPIIKDFCLREKLPHKYADMIYNRMITNRLLNGS